MIFNALEAGGLQLFGNDFGGVGDDVLEDLMGFIGQSEVHIADFLDSFEVELAFFEVSVGGRGRQEELHDHEEGDNGVTVELEALVVDWLVSGGGGHGLEHEHEVELHEVTQGGWGMGAQGGVVETGGKRPLLEVDMVVWVFWVGRKV